jgi:hypothetical protein
MQWLVLLRGLLTIGFLVCFGIKTLYELLHLSCPLQERMQWLVLLHGLLTIGL